MEISIHISGGTGEEIRSALADLIYGTIESDKCGFDAELVEEETEAVVAPVEAPAPAPPAPPKKTRATKKAEPVQLGIEDAVVVEETPPPTEKAAPPTIDDVKEVLKALIAGPGENPAFELLTKYGAKNATTLLETGLAHLAIAEARKLIEEHAG